MQGISLNTNVLSLLMQNQLAGTNGALSSSMEKLATGYKINHAKDGAAQLALSEKLQAQISGTKVAQENVQHGQLALDMADSSLQNINNNISAIRDLLVEAANGTYSQEQRNALALEAQGYLEQINSIAQQTSFNGLNLLDGSVTELKLQVGANAGEVLDISKAFTSADASTLGLKATELANAFKSASAASSYIETVDKAVDKTATQLASVGAYANSLDSTLENLAIRQTNLESSNSLIMDVDYASEVSKYVQLQILQQAGVSLLSQANTMPTLALSLLAG